MKKRQKQLGTMLIIFSFLALSSAQATTGSIDHLNLLQDTLTQPLTIEIPEYYALIIGIQTDPQSKSESSANALYQSLIDGANWKKENICLLTNENATKTSIQTTIQQWLAPQETSNDIVLIYWNGETEKLPLQQHTIGNTQTTTYQTSDSSEKISDKELDGWLDSLDSTHLFLILDTSYARYMTALKQRGRTILTSTNILFPKKQEHRYDLDTSLLSYFIKKGLQGYADINNDDDIDSDELFTYASYTSYQYSLTHLTVSLNRPIIHIQIPTIYKTLRSEKNLFTLSFGWKQLSDDGFGKNSNYATRGMEIFNNELYIGTQNNMMPNTLSLEQQSLGLTAATTFSDFYSFFGQFSRFPIRMGLHLMTLASQGCELWKYNHSEDTLTKVIGKHSLSGINAGFGSHYNAAASVIKKFNGHLYVGTWNTPIGGVLQPTRKGCEIWRTADGVHWEQVVGHQAPYITGGFGNPDNTGAWSIEVFQDCLYVGTMNWDFSDTGGCEIWRTADGVHWEQVVDHGFRPFMSETEREKEAINTYAWTMKEFQGELYMGTFNARLWLFNEQGTGCQLWKTKDGTEWEKVPLPNGMLNDSKDGFGEGENYGIRRMIIYNDELYVGIASSFFHDHGCEIWRFDGTDWFPVISDENPGITPEDKHYDGFGNTLNKYIWTMTVTNDNKLWVGTANGQVYLPLVYKGDREHSFIDTETHGCEIWCFDGNEWQPVIKNDIGLKPSGLGDSANLGARSMIEYPEGSGNLVIGTFKLFNPVPDMPREGCELWMRYVVTTD